MISLIEEEKRKTKTKEKNQNDVKKREKIWDIAKGVGIISIVIGHTTPISNLHEFVYTYHLVIFYFVTIYFYNEKKYGDKPFVYVGNKIKSTWSKYFFYTVILVLMHNLFLKFNMYSHESIKPFEMNSILIGILNSMVFKCSEKFGGALWFVPTLIFASGLFGGVVYWSRKISSRFITIEEEKRKYIKYSVIILLSIFLGYIGVYLNENKLMLSYYIHTSFLIIPICTLGYFLHEYIANFKKFNKLYISISTTIVSGIFLYIIVTNGMTIELSKQEIINGYMFYIVSFIGLIFCISLASIIEKIPMLKDAISLCGMQSFSIMALHFACIKSIDVIYSKIIHETNPEIISKWVTAYPEKLWIIYVIVGCTVPVIFGLLVEKIKTNFMKKSMIGEENGKQRN